MRTTAGSADSRLALGIVIVLCYIAVCCAVYWIWPSEPNICVEKRVIATPPAGHREGDDSEPDIDGTRTATFEARPRPRTPGPRPHDPALMSTSAVPRKKTYSREQETCDAMEILFGKPFHKVRPAFLKNPETNRRLEIDCYNDDLRVGAEFNGVQHSRFPNPFHQTRDAFEAQLRRDAYKLDLCKKVGVRLLVVPDTVRKGDVLRFLQNAIAKHGD